MKPLMRRRPGQQGSTLIEVLISILVVAIGLLGYAALLLNTQKKNNDAYYRTQATLMASDMLESMRANRTSALQGDYNIAIGSAPVSGGMAGADQARWKSNLAAGLPAGNGSVAVDLQGNTTIVIQWDGSGTGVPTAFVTQSAI
jgi:type IV pilus assembly protein PilV